MKRNQAVATLRPAASSTDGGNPAVRPSARGAAVLAGSLRAPGELEDRPTVMTRGELIFYLRDVHRYWSTPRISPREIEDLERQNLTQRTPTGLCAIRLTEHGALVKNGGNAGHGEISKVTFSRSPNDRQPLTRTKIHSKES